MADRKITIKRNNSGTVETLFPTTTVDQVVYYDSLAAATGGDGYISVFDSNNKLKPAHIPSVVMGGLNFKNALDLTATGGSNDTIHNLLTAKQGSGYESSLEPGDFWIITTAGVVSGFGSGASGNSSTWIVFGEEGEYEDTPSDSTSEEINLEIGDYIVFTHKEVYTTGSTTMNKYYFSVINNDERLATSARPGLISHTNQAKLDGIAASADNYGGFNVTDGTNSTTIGSGNNLTFTAGSNVSISESSGTVTIASTDTNDDTTYSVSLGGADDNVNLVLTAGGSGSGTDSVSFTAGSNVSLDLTGDTMEISSTNTIYTHPTYTTRSIDTSGVEVLDVFTSDSIGSVTNITKRTLPNATTSAAGVMSSTDKTKLDAANVVQYAAAATSSATYGFIFFDED
jgi:hypothetical protein